MAILHQHPPFHASFSDEKAQHELYIDTPKVQVYLNDESSWRRRGTVNFRLFAWRCMGGWI